MLRAMIPHSSWAIAETSFFFVPILLWRHFSGLRFVITITYAWLIIFCLLLLFFDFRVQVWSHQDHNKIELKTWKNRNLCVRDDAKNAISWMNKKTRCHSALVFIAHPTFYALNRMGKKSEIILSRTVWIKLISLWIDAFYA